MLKNKRKANIICLVAVLIVLAYLFHDIFNVNLRKYDTQIIDEIKIQDTLDLKGFIVRDEKFITGVTGETLVPLVEDGNRVASNDPVARVCNSSEDASNYSKLLECQNKLERYEKLEKQTELNALDMKKLNIEINERYTELLKVAAGGNYTELDDKITTFEDKTASKQILSTGTIELSSKMSELQSEINSLEEKNIKTTEVYAPLSGYYISTLDGYENTLSYSDIKDVPVSEIESAVNSKAANVTANLGKIVGSYKWYIVAVCDAKYEKMFRDTRTLRINIPYYGYERVLVDVENVSQNQDGKIALVLSCNLMNEAYANMRIENFQIVLNEYKGYKVSSSAIKEETDSEGNKINVVYILRSSIMNVRKVEIIYDAGDYVLVNEETEAGNGYYPVKRYDEVILKGRNLSNGKSIS